MGTKTKIAWCDHTWNPWRGCAKVSAGCDNCYAEQQSRRNPAVLGQWGPDAPRVVAADGYWRLPYRWCKAAERSGVRRRVFLGSLMDFFEARGDLRMPWAHAWMTTINTAYALDWLIVTKRPENAMRCVAQWADLTGESDEPQLVRGPEETRKAHPSGRGQIFADFIESLGPPPPGAAYPTFDWMEGPRWLPGRSQSVWLLTSVEDQKAAEIRIPKLLACREYIRLVGLSCEPLLGPLDLTLWLDRLDWVIVGGESGPKARPCAVEWIQRIVADCRMAHVPCFVKQLGSAATGLRNAKGGDPDEWPEDVRVREFPCWRPSRGTQP